MIQHAASPSHQHRGHCTADRGAAHLFYRVAFSPILAPGAKLAERPPVTDVLQRKVRGDVAWGCCRESTNYARRRRRRDSAGRLFSLPGVPIPSCPSQLPGSPWPPWQHIVGDATEQLGDIMGPAATGVLQSAIGNLPELFVGIFALRAGLIEVVQAALVGSILGNSLLVLGLAFLVGGLRNGTQHFGKEQPRMIATLTLLAVSALVVPTLAQKLHTPAGAHADTLSIACAIVLLVVFVASIPFSVRGGRGGEDDDAEQAAHWPYGYRSRCWASRALAPPSSRTGLWRRSSRPLRFSTFRRLLPDL